MLLWSMKTPPLRRVSFRLPFTSSLHCYGTLKPSAKRIQYARHSPTSPPRSAGFVLKQTYPRRRVFAITALPKKWVFKLASSPGRGFFLFDAAFPVSLSMRCSTRQSYGLSHSGFLGSFINMKDQSPSALAADKLQRKIAEWTLVVTGALITILVVIQICRDVISVIGGDVTAHSGSFSFALLDGILGCIGIIAFIISIATAKHLFHNHLRGLRARKS